MVQSKIFGVGLNKTGTTSLHHAMRSIGVRSLHHRPRWMSDATLTARVEQAVEAGAHPFRHVARLRIYDAFFDVRAVERHFDILDHRYPGSKFILHTRDKDEWIESRVKHVQKNIATGRSTWTTIDIPAWREKWEAHHERVARYFADRPEDLLVMNVAAGDGWDTLAPFLGIAAPTQPFPHTNVSAPASD